MSVCCEPEQTTPSSLFPARPPRSHAAAHAKLQPHGPPPSLFSASPCVLNQQQQQTSCLCFRFLSPCSRMSSNTFWSDACTYARNRPLPALLDAVYASCGATVRRAPAAAARRLSCSCLRCGLPCLLVTRCCADCGALCVRCGGREDAVSVVEDGRGGAAARVVAVRTVLRADGVRQLFRGCDVGGKDDGFSEWIQRQ